jgi:DNA-binding transcriptional LysR family regulator
VDTLSSINTFRQVVESGSFNAAAERLEISPATVSKRIMHVEQRLGVRLLNRNTRKFSLTDPGRLYFERCKTILEELQATEFELGSLDGAPRGTLRITSPSFTAAGRLTLLLAEYGRRFPEVLVDVSFEDRLVDLVEEGYDLALRLVLKEETLSQGLIARPIRRETFQLAASRPYVERRGLPHSPADLAQHDFVALRDVTSLPEGAVSPRIALCCRSTAAVVNAVAAGIGIGPVPAAVLEEPLFRDILIPVLAECPLQKGTLYIVYMHRKFMPRKVSSFLDFLFESLSPHTVRTVTRTVGEQNPSVPLRSIPSKFGPALRSPSAQKGPLAYGGSERARPLPP